MMKIKKLTRKQKESIRLRLADSDPAFKPRSIVFLDIDGVLNRNKDNHSHDAIRIDIGVLHQPQVDNLNRFLKETGASICLISSWRDQDGIWDIHQLLREAGIKGVFMSDAPYLNPGTSYDEIMTYLAEKQWESIPYVVLDDCNGYPECFQHKLVQTNRDHGFSVADVERAKIVLGADMSD